MGVIQFIENMDRTTLTVSGKEFEANVEAAVSAIAEKHQEREQTIPRNVHVSEKSSLSQPEVSPRTSMDGGWSSSRPSTSSRDVGLRSMAEAEDQAVAAGLLRTIQKPLSSIGRIFSEDNARHSSARDDTSLAPVTEARVSPRRSSSSHPQLENRSPERQSRTITSQQEDIQTRGRSHVAAEDAAARQASAELEEAHRIERLEHANVVEYVLHA